MTPSQRKRESDHHQVRDGPEMHTSSTANTTKDVVEIPEFKAPNGVRSSELLPLSIVFFNP